MPGSRIDKLRCNFAAYRIHPTPDTLVYPHRNTVVSNGARSHIEITDFRVRVPPPLPTIESGTPQLDGGRLESRVTSESRVTRRSHVDTLDTLLSLSRIRSCQSRVRCVPVNMSVGGVMGSLSTMLSLSVRRQRGLVSDCAESGLSCLVSAAWGLASAGEEFGHRTPIVGACDV